MTRDPSGFSNDVALGTARLGGSTPDRFVDVFHATARHVSATRARRRHWLEPLVAESLRRDLPVAGGEAAANAAEHESDGEPERIVSVEACLHEGTLRMSVSDSGYWSDDSTRARRRVGAGGSRS